LNYANFRPRTPGFQIGARPSHARTRQELEQLEREILAPYANSAPARAGGNTRNTTGMGATPIPARPDRVIHSRAFRRLDTRRRSPERHRATSARAMTTPWEVARHRAQHLAGHWKLNEDLAETIALAHDLGHAPFGHLARTF